MFCFGQSKYILLENLKIEIQELVSWRDFILVVHGGKWDLLFLQAAEVFHVLDTKRAVQHPLGLDYRCKLKDMLALLECPSGFRILHVASNNTTFTLRALLLIAIADAASINQSSLGDIQRHLPLAFEKIARAPIPLNGHQLSADERWKKEEVKARRGRERRAAQAEQNKIKRDRKESRRLDAYM